jgi:hypothetical protein
MERPPLFTHMCPRIATHPAMYHLKFLGNFQTFVLILACVSGAVVFLDKYLLPEFLYVLVVGTVMILQ